MVSNNSANLSKPLVQEIRANYATQTSTATTIPWDNTIPQITEGVELTTVTITPTNASNILVIEWCVQLQTNAIQSTAAIFQDSTANALACSPCETNFTDRQNTTSGIYSMVAGTVSATTFRLRAGPASGTLYINRTDSGARFGGVEMSYLSVKEFVV